MKCVQMTWTSLPWWWWCWWWCGCSQSSVPCFRVVMALYLPSTPILSQTERTNSLSWWQTARWQTLQIWRNQQSLHFFSSSLFLLIISSSSLFIRFSLLSSFSFNLLFHSDSLSHLVFLSLGVPVEERQQNWVFLFPSVLPSFSFLSKFLRLPSLCKFFTSSFFSFFLLSLFVFLELQILLDLLETLLYFSLVSVFCFTHMCVLLFKMKNKTFLLFLRVGKQMKKSLSFFFSEWRFFSIFFYLLCFSLHGVKSCE